MMHKNGKFQYCQQLKIAKLIISTIIIQDHNL